MDRAGRVARADLAESEGQEPARSPPAAPPIARLLALQRSAGNVAVARMLMRQQDGAAERELDKRWSVETTAVPEAVRNDLLGRDSLALTFYEAYETGLPNDRQFKDAAVEFAKDYKTLGLQPDDRSGASFRFAQPIAVKNHQDVSQAIVSVHQTLERLKQEQKAKVDYGKLEEVEASAKPVPPITKLVIFAHGIPKGLGLDPAGEPGHNWMGIEKIKSFVAAIRGSVAQNVSVALFACSTGGEPGEQNTKEKTNTPLDKMPEPDERRGGGTFAQVLAKELGGEATVYAHTIVAHAESNPQARRFDAHSPTGQHMFNLIYDDPFITETETWLRREKAALVKSTALKPALRKTMWDHYFDAVSVDFSRWNTNNRHFKAGGYGGIGAAMFMDPEGTTALLREDFRTVWLTDKRIAAL